MIKGQGGVIGAQMINATTGAAFAGAVTVYVDGDAQGQAIGVTGGGAVVSQGNGYYPYVAAASETNHDQIAFTFVGVGAIPVTIQIATITPAQVSALQSATGLASVVAQDVIVGALTKIRVARAGDVVNPEDLALGLLELNSLLDRWNANPRARFNVGFVSYVLTPNHQPHTIGPNGADFAVTARPVKITGANLILTDVTPAVRVPITIRDDAWWLSVSVQGIATTIPTDLYYSPDWPNGALYLWPVPTTAYSLELLTDGLFGVLQLQDTFWLPFGYRDAITKELAVEFAPSFGQTPAPGLIDSAREARDVIFGNNDETPYIATQDSGIPSRGTGQGSFNFRSRSFS